MPRSSYSQQNLPATFGDRSRRMLQQTAKEIAEDIGGVNSRVSMIIDGVPQPEEIQDTRIGFDGTVYKTAKDRLDAEREQTVKDLDSLNYTKADQSFVDAQLAALLNGSPTDVFDTLQDLQAAHPNGANGVYVTRDNNHWYYYNQDVSAWADGGVYRPDGLQNGAVTMEKINQDALAFDGYKVVNKGFNNVYIGLKFVFDIRSINFVGKKARFGFSFHTGDQRASTFHARYRLSTRREGLDTHPMPFDSNDGASNVIDTGTIYNYQDGERTGVNDANYLFCYIWVNLKDVANDFSFYYRNIRMTIDGVSYAPTFIEAHGGSFVSERVQTLDNQLSTVGRSKAIAADVLRSNRDFNGLLSAVSGFNNQYFAVCYAYDVRDINFNGAKVDTTFSFNADHSDITQVHTRYRLSTSPNELENSATPIADGDAIAPRSNEIYQYVDVGRKSNANGAYLLVYIWVPLRATLNYGMIFHTRPIVKINDATVTPVVERAHSGTISQAKVERLPSQLLKGRDKYETLITPFSKQDLVLTGDSITQSAGGFTSKYWHQHVQDELQFRSVHNYGIGGSTVGKQGGGTANNPIIDRYKDMVPGHYMGIFAGTNDYSRFVDLGVFDSRDTSTFYGAYHSLLEGMIEHFTDAKLFTMTPLPRVMDGPREGSPYHLEQYVEAVLEVSAAHSVPCLDLYHASGLHPKNAKHQEKFFADGVHPNDLGHTRFAPKVTQFLRAV